MEDIEERIKKIEEEIRKTPYHKGTEHYVGLLRARIARLKDELQIKKGSGGGGGGLPADRRGFAVRKTGDATVVLVGPPSVGKSTLINQLSSAASRVGSYDFTTTQVIPGMMEYKGAKIQILDVPGLISGAAQGKGRGREVISVARVADLLILMVDINTRHLLYRLKEELYQAGIRLEEAKPNVLVSQKDTGGIKVVVTARLTRISPEIIAGVAKEFKLRNGEIIVREDISLDQLIDCFSANRVYLPYLMVANKADQLSLKEAEETKDRLLCISAQKGIGLEELKEKIWTKLGLLRVYLKSKDKGIDFSSPLILREGDTLNTILEKITLPSQELIKSAKIYGPGAKFPGQEVNLNFKPKDEEVVSFV